MVAIFNFDGVTLQLKHARRLGNMTKYASENGNWKAISHFKEGLSTLKESTVKNFQAGF